MLEFFGYVSGFFAIVEFIPYIKDIFLKKTKPHRVTFLLWAILGVIVFFTQLAKGASNSLWLPGIETVGVLFIFFLSLPYGLGGFSKHDKIALLLAGIGLVIWYLTKEATFALYITIFVDAIGCYLTIHKTYFMPESETLSAWIFAMLSGIFALFSVGKLDIILLSYPLYIMVANSAVILAILIGKRTTKR